MLSPILIWPSWEVHVVRKWDLDFKIEFLRFWMYVLPTAECMVWYIGAIALSYPSFCYWWLITKKRGWKLCRSPNPNPRGIRKCNSADISVLRLWRLSSAMTALKNFSFRKNWVGSEMVGMKITFFAIFDLTWDHILASKRPKYGIPKAGEFEFSVP